MIMLDEKAVDELLSYGALVDHFETCHQDPMPLLDDLLLECENDNGTQNAFLNRAAWDNNKWLGIKCVTVFPDNITQDQPLPSIQAVFILFDGVTGTPNAIIDGASLTRWKTACDSALGSHLLSREGAETLSMLGAGNMAEPLIRAHVSVRPGIRTVRIWNRSVDKAHALAVGLQGESFECVVAENLEDAVAGADIVVAATMASAPIIQGEWLQPGMHLDLVGAFTPTMREADDEAMRRGEIFVDCRGTTIDEIGELILPLQSGAISRKDIRADLFDLCAGTHPGRSDAAAITIFKNGGGGHLDLMAATHIFQQFQKA